MTTHLPRIVLTPGEPAGIGPDICLQLTRQHLPCALVVIASPELMRQRASLLGLPLAIDLFDPSSPVAAHRPGRLLMLPVPLSAAVQPGQLNVANSHYVIETLKKAIMGCVEGIFSALVTAPVHKGIINDSGFPFAGHTEFIAELTGGYPVMMLATKGLRVALATIHIPLAQVSGAITQERLKATISVLEHDLRERFHISRPRILVCGLNPHAGEGGHLGREEINTIQPVLSYFQDQGFDIQGPFPADTVFTPKYLNSADAVLAMYHDQGLPVLKYRSFGQAVNITLGLPIIRTSVDHGTALELAGTGQADVGSLALALQTALSMTTIGS